MIDNLEEVTQEKNVNKSHLRRVPQSITSHRYDALVLDAMLRQSLVTVRSLGKRGYRVAALESSAAPAFSSRWCRHGFIYSANERSLSYLDYLEQALDRTEARVLIPSSDGTIALLREHRKCLEQRTRIALAKEPALAIAVNKEQTLSIAARLGLSVPRSVTVEAVDAVPSALKAIGLPLVVKPVESWVAIDQTGLQGTRIAPRLVTTAAEAYHAVEELAAQGGTVLFQQYLSGRREAISFLYASGKVHARFAQWARRTEPPLGGTSVLRQSIAIPQDSGGQAERLVREIDLEGYAEVEFRRDSIGVPYLMEINPRLSASVEIAVRSGVDFPSLLYQWASGERIDSITSYHTGNWMRYLGGDMMTTIAALQQRGRPGVPPPMQATLAFCSSFLQPMDYDYLDWHDLAPALKATASFTRSWLGEAMKKHIKRAFSA